MTSVDCASVRVICGVSIMGTCPNRECVASWKRWLCAPLFGTLNRVGKRRLISVFGVLKRGGTMAVRRVREVGRFSARAEDGTVYRIIEYAHMQDVRTRATPNARDVEGLHELTTHDGMRVNVVGENEYEIVDLALKLKRVHPR